MVLSCYLSKNRSDKDLVSKQILITPDEDDKQPNFQKSHCHLSRTLRKITLNNINNPYLYQFRSRLCPVLYFNSLAVDVAINNLLSKYIYKMMYLARKNVFLTL